jgi:hypothetical protein
MNGLSISNRDNLKLDKTEDEFYNPILRVLTQRKGEKR